MTKTLRLILMLAISLSGAQVTAAWAAEVEMETSKGTLIIRVDEENAPVTAKNFLQYVSDGFYDGLIFHRVIPNFVIQGGGFNKEMRRSETRAPIKNESDNGLKNLRYSLSMARTNEPDSANSQFFINLKDNAFLDSAEGKVGYAVFGEVIEGQDVVDAIAVVPTGNVGPFQDVPKEPVIITRATVRE